MFFVIKGIYSKHGYVHVTILHFMGENDMTANSDEIEMAQIDGVEFIHYAQTVRIMENAVRCVRNVLLSIMVPPFSVAFIVL